MNSNPTYAAQAHEIVTEEDDDFLDDDSNDTPILGDHNP